MWLEGALWLAAALALGAGIIGWQGSAAALLVRRAAPTSGSLEVQRVDADTLEGAVMTVVESDPFRLERRPSSVIYRPELEGAPPPVPPSPPPPKPALTLGGVAGGPPWEAVVEGIPGREGPAVVRAGQVVGDFRVRSVGRDTVVIQGADTVWRLTLKKPWP